MKIAMIFFLLCAVKGISAQTADANLYGAHKHRKNFYAEKSQEYFIIYSMGKYLDKAGFGYSVLSTDTAHLQADKSYLGKEYLINNQNSQLSISNINRSKKKYDLNPIKSAKETYAVLNNAYYLDNYFAMAKEVPSDSANGYFSFRRGFFDWKKVPFKEMNYKEFRKYADAEILAVRDSVTKR